MSLRTARIYGRTNSVAAEAPDAAAEALNPGSFWRASRSTACSTWEYTSSVRLIVLWRASTWATLGMTPAMARWVIERVPQPVEISKPALAVLVLEEVATLSLLLLLPLCLLNPRLLEDIRNHPFGYADHRQGEHQPVWKEGPGPPPIGRDLTAEYPVRTEGYGRILDEWTAKPNRDNHWFDCLWRESALQIMNLVDVHGKPLTFTYDAISGTGKRRQSSPLLRSEDRELWPFQRKQLVANTRDLQRNFAIAAWMIRRHLDYVTTMTFHARSGWTVPLRTERPCACCPGR